MTATALMVRPFVRGHRVVDFRLWRLLVVGGAPLLALTFLNLLYGTLDVPILHAISGSEPVGWYGVALKWVGIPLFITTAVGTAYYPAFSAQGKPVTKEFAPLVNRAVHLVLFVTIPASFGLIFVADDVVRLIYKPEFDPSIVLIQILAVRDPDHRHRYGPGDGADRGRPGEGLPRGRRHRGVLQSDLERGGDPSHRQPLRQRRDRRPP